MLSWRSVAIVVLCASAIGCSDGGGDDDGGNAVVELGTGTIDFEPMAADAELEIIAGPQGGHHFIVHARAQNIIPGDPSIPGLDANPRTTFAAFTETGEQIDMMFPPYTLGYRRDGDWLVLPSGRILQVHDEVVDSLIGHRVRITVHVIDAAGTSGDDERWITAVAGQVPDNDAGVSDAGTPDAGAMIDAGPPDAAASL